MPGDEEVQLERGGGRVLLPAGRRCYHAPLATYPLCGPEKPCYLASAGPVASLPVVVELPAACAVRADN